ncbi:MAG: hypothetical protein WBW79_03395 [Desulfocapsaceae bacterium]
MSSNKPEKLKMFEYDDTQLGETVKVKGKSGSDKIEVKIGSGHWQEIDFYKPGDPPPSPPYDPGTNPALSDLDYGYIRGSRWVYINGRWYKIG